MAEFLTQPANSRYKDTLIHRTPGVGLEYGIYREPEEFREADDNFQTYRVDQRDVGFLDRVAALYYGDEMLWWVVAQANRIVDPENELEPGDTLIIPDRDTVSRFLARGSTDAPFA